MGRGRDREYECAGKWERVASSCIPKASAMHRHKHRHPSLPPPLPPPLL
jgi:hypothetical protein